MISVTYDKTAAVSSRYKAVVLLKGTVVETLAQYGVGNDEPHAIGYGYSPTGAINNAYQCLGEYLYSRKSEPKEIEDPPL